MGKIVLTEDLYLGSGVHKKTYLHPYDKTKCIKVCCAGGAPKSSFREIEYLKRIKNTSSILPKYFGEVETSLGTGYVYQLMNDYDGSTSVTLEYYFSNEKLFEENFYELVELTLRLIETMYDEKIVTMNIFPDNILVRKLSKDNKRLVIVDDLGTASFIPVEYYIDYFAKTRITRRLNRFFDALRHDYQSKVMNEYISAVKSLSNI